VLALFAAVIALNPPGQAQSQSTLRRIEIVGLQRLSPDAVIQSSGLQLGQAVDDRMIDAAANKLMASGLFSRLSYRVRIADSDLTVIFEVEEKTASAPVTPDSLGQVRWIGNQVLSSEELSAAFAMKLGNPADRARVDNGLEAVRKVYARKGYIDVHISEFRTRDALNRRMNYEFSVREGQQYRMGTLVVTGLAPEDARRLKTKWTMAANAIFDNSYLDDFKQTVIRPFVVNLTQRSRARTRFEVVTRPEAQKQTVDVVITFK
jgi:outer membrane protein assembly factor BamA